MISNRLPGFRLIVVALVVFALWSGAEAHPGFVREWPAVGLAGLWTATVFLRAPQRWRLSVALGSFAIALATSYLYPGLGTLLFVSVGALGAQVPWRVLRYVGIPLVLLTAMLLVPIRDTMAILNSAFILAIILLLGRMITENNEARSGQAEALKRLQAANAELQRRADEVEELTVLRERSRMSRELHDTMGHALSAITVQLEAVRRLSRHDPERADALIVEAQEAGRTAMGELRAHLSTLREPTVGLDLSVSLTRLAEDCARRNGWTLDLDVRTVQLPYNTAGTLLQVAREALTNSERHAGARRVHVASQVRNGFAELTIADDGRGFDPRAAAPGHYGLQMMRERIEDLGGELRVQSGPGEGTRVMARLPAGQAGAEGSGVEREDSHPDR